MLLLHDGVAGWVPASGNNGSRVFRCLDGWVVRVSCAVYVYVIVYFDVCMRAYACVCAHVNMRALCILHMHLCLFCVC